MRSLSLTHSRFTRTFMTATAKFIFRVHFNSQKEKTTHKLFSPEFPDGKKLKLRAGILFGRRRWRSVEPAAGGGKTAAAVLSAAESREKERKRRSKARARAKRSSPKPWTTERRVLQLDSSSKTFRTSKRIFIPKSRFTASCKRAKLQPFAIGVCVIMIRSGFSIKTRCDRPRSTGH